MSTKISLSWNSPNAINGTVPEINRDQSCPNYHLYADAFDDDAVYLSMDGATFECSNNGVTVRIPLVIWNRIIKVQQIKK